MAINGEVLADRYRLDQEIATGGMGTVWRAHDQLLTRPVAIKLLNDSLASDGLAVERFRREATTAASVSHPNMANVFDYIEHGGRPGIVMELVEGETLAALLAREGALDVDETLRISDASLAALAGAHAAGIVHRDIKPGNILLTPSGGVKVADFGIARAANDATLTLAGSVLGTAHYSSPEQVRGSPATARSDLYSFGVVLYEMLTGKRPFDAETAVAVALMRLSTDPTPPRAHRPDLPVWLDRAVMRAMAREPEDRYEDAVAMRAAMRLPEAPATERMSFGDANTVALPNAPAAAARQEHSPAGAPASPHQAPPPGRRRRPIPALVAWTAPLVIGLLVGAVIAVTRGPGVVAVPALTDKNLAAARAEASALNLDVRVVRRESARPAGIVLDQNPSEETRVEEGTTVTLIVSNGVPPCCVVPDLRGMTLDEATAALADVQLELDAAVPTFGGEATPGTVVAQEPGDGARLSPGDGVDVSYEGTLPSDEHPGKGKGHKDD